MAHEMMRTTVRFSRPFRLPGAPASLPPGDYPIEWRQHFLDDVAMPEAPGTEVRLDSGGAAGILIVRWADLRAALAQDRPPPAPPGKLPLAALLEDPLIRLVMSSDGVSGHAVLRTLRAARMRRQGRALLAGRAGSVPPHLPGRHATRTPRTPAPSTPARV